MRFVRARALALRPSSKESAPAKTSAVYSPSEKPAATLIFFSISGASFFAFSMAASDTVKMAGCARMHTHRPPRPSAARTRVRQSLPAAFASLACLTQQAHLGVESGVELLLRALRAEAYHVVAHDLGGEVEECLDVLVLEQLGGHADLLRALAWK
eukprot:6189480-Pleurochrysis_carterae.AAC.2